MNAVDWLVRVWEHGNLVLQTVLLGWIVIRLEWVTEIVKQHEEKFKRLVPVFQKGK